MEPSRPLDRPAVSFLRGEEWELFLSDGFASQIGRIGGVSVAFGKRIDDFHHGAVGLVT